MRYFLDTEYNGFGGALISLALVPEYGDDEFYAILKCPDPIVAWVERHVIPYLDTAKITDLQEPTAKMSKSAIESDTGVRFSASCVITAWSASSSISKGSL